MLLSNTPCTGILFAPQAWSNQKNPPVCAQRSGEPGLIGCTGTETLPRAIGASSAPSPARQVRKLPGGDLHLEYKPGHGRDPAAGRNQTDTDPSPASIPGASSSLRVLREGLRAPRGGPGAVSAPKRCLRRAREARSPLGRWHVAVTRPRSPAARLSH